MNKLLKRIAEFSDEQMQIIKDLQAADPSELGGPKREVIQLSPELQQEKERILKSPNYRDANGNVAVLLYFVDKQNGYRDEIDRLLTEGMSKFIGSLNNKDPEANKWKEAVCESFTRKMKEVKELFKKLHFEFDDVNYWSDSKINQICRRIQFAQKTPDRIISDIIFGQAQAASGNRSFRAQQAPRLMRKLAAKVANTDNNQFSTFVFAVDNNKPIFLLAKEDDMMTGIDNIKSAILNGLADAEQFIKNNNLPDESVIRTVNADIIDLIVDMREAETLKDAVLMLIDYANKLGKKYDLNELYVEDDVDDEDEIDVDEDIPSDDEEENDNEELLLTEEDLKKDKQASSFPTRVNMRRLAVKL